MASEQLSPVVGHISPSHITNTTNFIDKIKNIDPREFHFVSFDAISLFTSVPVPLALSLLEHHLQDSQHTLAYSFDFIKQLINLTLEHNFFHYNSNYFKQKQGLSMGSPLSPIISNLFME